MRGTRPLLGQSARTASLTLSSGLLAEPQRLVLEAVTGTGPVAVEAFRRWRTLVPFDNIEHSALRVIPLILALLKREGIDDPDLRRMKGIERHIWASNTLRLKHLFQAIEAIQKARAPFVVIKGGALQARIPEIAGLRTNGDYDLLIDPAYLQSVRRELEAADFVTPGFSFDDWEDLRGSNTAGVPIVRRGTVAEIDIHWRALPYLRDPELTKVILKGAEKAPLLQHQVPIPSLAHHLFICVARCEPWNPDECLTRVLEAHFLLSRQNNAVDWIEVQRLISKYRLEACAAAFFAEIPSTPEICIPDSVRKGLSPWAVRLQKDWTTRAVAPPKRTELQRWLIHNTDVRYSRKKNTDWAPSLREAVLATNNHDGAKLPAIWRSASRRVSGLSTGRRRFLYGFSIPEVWGRWTEGKLAYAVIPLNSEERAGRPVEIKCHALDPIRPTTVYLTGGRESQKTVIEKGQTEVTLTVALRSLSNLDGDGLLALWLPDAVTPRQLGINTDDRPLCLAFHRT